MDVDVIVVGAGCGGLSAGALLAGQGRQVLVLDQSDSVGGAVSSFQRAGYTFDVGASIFEVLQPLARLFAALGTTLGDELDLLACDPAFSVVYRDGQRIRFPPSDEGIVDALGRVSADDARNWHRYASYCAQLYDVLLDTVYVQPMSTPADLLHLLTRRPALAKYLPGLLTSYQSVLSRFFSDRGQESFAFQALSLGLPPELLPGLYAFLPYGELRGAHYPAGGMAAIPRALRRVGERHGMKVQLNAPVRQVLVERRRAIGVELADGTVIRSRVVVGNVNAKTMYLHMIDQRHLPPRVRRGVASYQYDNSCAVVYLGIDYAPPLDAHHTFVAPSVGEANRWWRDRAHRPLPDPPFGMIDFPSYTDPAIAPDGHHVLNVTTVAPYQGVDWDHHKPRFIDDVIKWLSEGLVPDVADHVQIAACASPLDFERRIGLGQGGLHGLRQDATHTTVFRPSNKSKCIDGLYLVGASTNPGGGVPTVIASGTITAGLVDRFEK